MEERPTEYAEYEVIFDKPEKRSHTTYRPDADILETADAVKITESGLFLAKGQTLREERGWKIGKILSKVGETTQHRDTVTFEERGTDMASASRILEESRTCPVFTNLLWVRSSL